MNEKPDTILIVDDIQQNLVVLNDILVQQGYDVRPASNGQIALEFASRFQPDLILLDIKMPGLDGFEVCSRLKANPRTAHIPVMFITAVDDTESKVNGFRLGGVDFISKPFEPNELLARVQTHLELQKLRIQLEKQNHWLQEMAHLREDIERIMHHDLKGPLTRIFGYAQILKDSKNLTAVEIDWADRIEKAGMRMLNTIEQTNILFKIENRTYELHPVKIDILVEIKEILIELEQLINRMHPDISIKVNGKPKNVSDHFFIIGEKTLAHNMLENLIRNAVEASESGDWILIKLDSGNNQTISIGNRAVVPTEIKDTFFNKYVTTGKMKGTGLGTYSAKLAAEVQNGTISMVSSPETGTWVTMQFPLVTE